MPAKDPKLCVGLVFDDSLDRNDGVAQQVKRLGEYLSAHGHKVVYLCGETQMSEHAGGKVYSLSKNLNVKFNGNRLSMPLISHRRNIKSVIKSESLDILHVMTPYSPLFAQRAIRIVDGLGIPIVGSFHILPSGIVSSFGARLLGLLQYFSLKRFSGFTSTSKNAAKFAKQTMRIESVVVPNMVNLSQFQQAQTEKKVSGRIVFLGRLVERKGCKQLIESFQIVANRLPEASLVIAGDGPQRTELESLCSRLGLNSKIKFLGFIDEADKPKILSSASVACFPALYGESFGVVLIEAMAAGSGVVLAGDNPGYRCVMEQQPKLLVDPKDKHALADRLIGLLQGGQYQTLHDWQLEHVKQYDVNVVGRQFLNVYAKAIAKKLDKQHN